MGELIEFFKNKKNLINLLFLGILVLALPLGINLVRQQQILKSRAVVAPIAFVGENVKLANGQWVALKPQITVVLTSDLGPPAAASASKTVQKDKGLVSKVYAQSPGDPCTYPENCPEGGVRTCNGTFNNGVCGYDFNVDPACSECSGGGGGGECSPGQERFNCSGQCGGCAAGQSGEMIKDVCNSSGNWQFSASYCDGNCSQYCPVSGGSPLPSTSPRPTASGGGSGRQCKTSFEPSELGINNCSVCDRLHTYYLVDQSGNKTSCSLNNTCTKNSDCRQNKDQPIYIDPTTSNWCYGFADGARCLQLRYDGTGTEPSCGPGDKPRDPQCDASPKPSGSGGGTVGECTVSWQLSNENPAPGSTIQVKVRGVSDPKGWQNIELFLDGSTRDFGWGGIENPWPTFVYNSVPAGSAGSHTLKFTTDKGLRVCTPQKTFTSGTVTSSPAPSPSAQVSPSPTSPPVVTVQFRVAETKDGLNTAPWQSYTKDGIEVDFEFVDKTPGPKQVWVEFKDSNGKTSTHFANIRLLGPGPTIASCGLIFEGSNVVFDIKGTNFGAEKGLAKSGDKGLAVKEWSDTSAKVVMANPPVGQTFPITLTNTDGQVGEGQCSAISTISLGAKVFCRAPSQHDTDNVNLILVGLFEGGQKITETVRIDKNGFIQNLTQRLEEGRKYSLSLKAPLSLRRTVEITAGKGVTIVPNFILPVGDIFPKDGGDGTINSFDKGELDRQWIIALPAPGRTGDFNRDTRVNSVDWACMRYDFGQKDDPEPSPGAVVASPSPRPSPSPNPSASPAGGVCIQVITPAKNPTTGECKDFPTPCDVPTGWQIVASCSTN